MKVELREGDGQRGWQSFLLRGWPGSLGSSPGGRQGAVTCMPRGRSACGLSGGQWDSDSTELI